MKKILTELKSENNLKNFSVGYLFSFIHLNKQFEKKFLWYNSIISFLYWKWKIEKTNDYGQFFMSN